MTRDYKPAPSKPASAGKGNPFLNGLLTGLILGIGAAIAVALLVRGGGNPFVDKASAPALTEPIVAPAPTDAPPAANPAAPQATADKPPEKPRFDFYTILPGAETAVTDQQVQQATTTQQGSPASADKNYFLQVGVFQNEADADNLKARLALLGLEAVVQTANLPDKGISHRVRVGPLTDLEQIRKTRTELSKNGFDAFLIQQTSTLPDQ